MREFVIFRPKHARFLLNILTGQSRAGNRHILPKSSTFLTEHIEKKPTPADLVICILLITLSLGLA